MTSGKLGEDNVFDAKKFSWVCFKKTSYSKMTEWN